MIGVIFTYLDKLGLIWIFIFLGFWMLVNKYFVYPKSKRTVENNKLSDDVRPCIDSSFLGKQSDVINSANQLLSETKPLGEFESEVMCATMKRLMKDKPTLPLRK